MLHPRILPRFGTVVKCKANLIRYHANLLMLTEQDDDVTCTDIVNKDIKETSVSVFHSHEDPKVTYNVVVCRRVTSMSVDKSHVVQFEYLEHEINVYINDNPIRQFGIKNTKLSLSDSLKIRSWIGDDTHRLKERLWDFEHTDPFI